MKEPSWAEKRVWQRAAWKDDLTAEKWVHHWAGSKADCWEHQ